MKNIKDLENHDKPREKLISKGISSLKNRELLALIFGSGQKRYPLSKLSRSVEKFLDTNPEPNLKDLTAIPGIGTARACQLLAAFELTERMRFPSDQVHISSSEDIVTLLSSYRSKKQEHFVTITLDGAHNVINAKNIFIGTLNQSLVHPREVFAQAIEDRAASIVIAHNHPSENTSPSNEDISVTKRLIEAGRILGIEILDHVILTRNDHFSFKAHHLI